MFFHATQVPNIKILKPHISNHGKPLIYMSKKRENVLVYLSNAVELYCKSIGYDYSGIFHKWASYGFTQNGILRIEEYYPNATIETYKGVSGFIYSTNSIDNYQEQEDIPFAVTTESSVTVSNCEFIEDAYEAILRAAENGELIIKRYEENSPEMLAWIQKTIVNEYEQAKGHPEYREFLKAKFKFLSY